MEWYWSAFVSFISMIGGAVGWRFIRNYLALRSGNYSIDKAKRTDMLDEYRDFIQTLQKEHVALRAELERRSAQYEAELKRRSELYKAEIDRRIASEEARVRETAECEARYARAEERITALEDALTVAGIKHRPWKRPTNNTGTDQHTPLPPSTTQGDK